MAGSRPLVLGSGGQLGTAFSNEVDARLLTRSDLDLETASRVEIERVVAEADPTVVFNCAAYTAVDRAEEEEDVATRVNGLAVGWLAEVAAEVGVPFVTYSTDYVFDGSASAPYREDDTPSPVNAYGRSKRVGEEAALARAEALVIRTSWVLSTTHRNFVTAILGRAVEGKPLKVVDDQRGRPTVAHDLARASLQAVDRKVSGLLHLANQGETTWYEVARAAVEMAGLDPGLVSPCPTEEYPTPAPRPAYSILDTRRAQELGIDPLPHWRDSLLEVVEGALRLIH